VTVGRERATRRQAEALSSEVERRNIELFVSREQFFTTLRSIGDAVISTDRGGKVTFLNGVAEALTGWSNAEAAGKPLEEVFVIINESSRQSVENPVERVIREGIVVGLANHTILVNRDGSEAAIADSAAPIRRDDGELVGVVLVFRDVSAERDDERRQRFVARGAVELSSSLDYETTLSTVAQLAVPEFADWCAVDLLEPGGLRRLAVAHIDPAKVSLVGEIARRYPADPNAKNGSPNILRTGEAEMIADIPVALLDAAARDEEHLTLIRQLSLRSYIGAPLKSRGSIIGVISFAMAESNRLYRESDLRAAQAIAERAATAIDNARLYREAQRLRGDAELANRAKDEFLAMLGHELRNPLAPIVSALHLVRARVGQQIERELTILERQVRHVVRLVDDLLDVSRIARGRIQLQREPVDLPDVVAKAAELARPLLDEKEHRLTVQVPAGLAVSGDPVRLTQVMSNLLNNAAKYTDAGGLIEVSAAREGDKIVLRVRDNGIGISPEVLPRVFDMFVQEPQSIDRTKGGLGLGLAIVRTLVTAHDGTVGAHSDGTGRGTELRVELPALPEGTLVPARGHAATLEAHAIGRPATRLLVVDDNADAAELLSDSLTLLGYEAHRAHDAEAALKLAAQVRPEVAVLDLGLPVIDGYELARRLRELEGLSGLRLIAVTGYGQSSDRDRSKAAGFDAHLVKPITVDEIHRVLEAL
jgi:PAS domain S-box-containing protein